MINALRRYAIVLAIAVLGSTPGIAGGTDSDSLAQLIVMRLDLMDEVAAYKFLNDVPVEDREREAVVLSRAVEAAEDAGLDGATTVAFFSAQIEAAKAIQSCWIERWRRGDASAPAAAPDLTGAIRPRLIEIGDTMIAAIADRAGQPGEIDPGALPTIDCLAQDKADAIVTSLATVSTASD